MKKSHIYICRRKLGYNWINGMELVFQIKLKCQRLEELNDRPFSIPKWRDEKIGVIECQELVHLRDYVRTGLFCTLYMSITFK